MKRLLVLFLVLVLAAMIVAAIISIPVEITMKDGSNFPKWFLVFRSMVVGFGFSVLLCVGIVFIMFGDSIIEKAKNALSEAKESFLRFLGIGGKMIPAKISVGLAAKMLDVSESQVVLIRDFGLRTLEGIHHANNGKGTLLWLSLSFGQKEAVDRKDPRRRVRLSGAYPVTTTLSNNAYGVIRTIEHASGFLFKE